MFEDINTYFTLEMIYLWLNIGIFPFWFVLFFFPKSKICKILAISIFPFLIFCIIYCYLIYIFFHDNFNFLTSFNLYLGIHELINLFSDTSFVILFWIHFLSINLFCGAWIVNDYQKISISKIIIFIPLVITYLMGPVGIVIYWIIKIFYTKRISLYE